eukprot:4368872-Amphidinium_carterae.1
MKVLGDLQASGGASDRCWAVSPPPPPKTVVSRHTLRLVTSCRTQTKAEEHAKHTKRKRSASTNECFAPATTVRTIIIPVGGKFAPWRGKYDHVLTLSAGLQALAFALLALEARSEVLQRASTTPPTTKLLLAPRNNTTAIQFKRDHVFN